MPKPLHSALACYTSYPNLKCCIAICMPLFLKTDSIPCMRHRINRIGERLRSEISVHDRLIAGRFHQFVYEFRERKTRLLWVNVL